MFYPPVILIHRGNSFYLAHTIAQARSSNPESRLILLGDRSNSFYLGVEHHRYEDHFEEAREFAKLFTYEYFPTYQYPWILFCHQKYFALRDFVRAQGIDQFLLIDSDVMIYEPIGPYFEHYKDYRMTLSASSTPSAQAAFAIVNDSTIIAALCDVFVELFHSNPENLATRFGTNLFTEMLGLGLLMKESSSQIKNTYEDNGEFVVHHNMLDDSRFDKDGECSRIIWMENIPMLRKREDGYLSKSPILHFHGHAKKQMGKYLQLTGIRTRVEHAANRGISAVAKYPMRATNKIAGRRVFPGI